MTPALAIAFGAMIGLLLGTVGGGGSILTVPVLVYALGLGVHEATATSLLIVGGTAIAGVVPHARAGRVAIKTALTFGAAGITGAFAGTWLNARVSGPVILLLFGALMVVVAARMAFRSRPSAGEEAAATVGFHWTVLATGAFVGLMTGFFGVGGGFLIVPALVLILRLPMRLAVGTSLVIIAINSAAGVVAHLGRGGMDIPLAALFIAGGFAGAIGGSRFAGHANDVVLARAFAILVAGLGTFLVIRNGVALV